MPSNSAKQDVVAKASGTHDDKMTTTAESMARARQRQQAGRLAEAEAICQQVVLAEPENAAAWHMLGAISLSAGKYELAAANLQLAVKHAPASAEAQNYLGVALHAQGKLDQAVVFYRRAVELNPDYAEALNHLANALDDQGKTAEALGLYRRAIELEPNYAAAFTNLGSCLLKQEEFEEAARYHQRALEIQPDLAQAYNNLGTALQKLQRWDEAIDCYRQFLQLCPNVPEGHVNLGNALKNVGQLADAAACYRRAAELRPDYAWAHVNQATMKLIAGDFAAGWSEYEWRWKTGKLLTRAFSRPMWQGQRLEGKTILLSAEQGFGDVIQFIRYAPLVKSYGGQVVVECPSRLINLLASCPGIDGLYDEQGDLPELDCHAPLMSLPAIFKTSIDTIPRQIPYLFADPRLVDSWRTRLSSVRGFRIGLNWRGRSGRGTFRSRDLSLPQLASVAQIPGVQLISLQQRPTPEEREFFQKSLAMIDLGDEVDAAQGAFMDTAAIMMNLDLSITSDTAIAHLAGALGVPVWVALPFVPDWRWLLGRSDSPWYPTMRLFRQTAPGHWEGSLGDIRNSLRQQVVA